MENLCGGQGRGSDVLTQELAMLFLSQLVVGSACLHFPGLGLQSKVVLLSPLCSS